MTAIAHAADYSAPPGMASPREAEAFISRLIHDPAFVSTGAVHAQADGCWWSVVHPRAHPLRVWRTSAPLGYGRTGLELDAAVFTNGPMMGKRDGSGVKITRRSAGIMFAGLPIAGIMAGLLVTRLWPGLPSPFYRLCAIGGAALGGLLAVCAVFRNWIPCGAIRSMRSGIDDNRNFDQEGDTHAWFARWGEDFASYRIGTGTLPDGAREGLGGLILLVRSFVPSSNVPGAPGFDRDFAQLSEKTGVVAWGLLPLRRHGLDGVILVVGSQHLDCRAITAKLRLLGVRDAVAMDQSGCIMMGTGGHFMIGPPPLYRQAMQTYGLCCA
ncbi:MAG TPA: hypothetical protein VKW08_18705 [Xanthobacteraceae bacterium]|jgi:hypothetical protein|nr:hypothetical protein [Xanthobacteraceae bacterium]